MTSSKEKTFAEEEIERIAKQQEEERFLQPLEMHQIEFKMGEDKMTIEKENKLTEIFKRNYKEFKVGSNASRVIVECYEAGKAEAIKQVEIIYKKLFCRCSKMKGVCRSCDDWELVESKLGELAK